MTESNRKRIGDFCWTELATTDTDKAKKFYAEVLGWTFEDLMMGPDMPYIMIKVDGHENGAMYTLMEEQRKHNIPSHWLTYVLVKDTDATIKKAEELGGTKMMGPHDVPEKGRMAILQDNTKATFAVWEAKGQAGVVVPQNLHGAFCWSELNTDNTEIAGKFYTELFNWKLKADSGPSELRYTELINDQRAIGGMMAIKKEWGPVPPHWNNYFTVDDCDVTAKKAETAGAKTLVPPTTIENVGRFAVLEDPTGGQFSIIKLTGPSR